jgi:hypothetical protein
MKRKFIVLGIIVTVLLGLIIYTNFINPCEISEKNVSIFVCDNDYAGTDEPYNTEKFEALVDRYEGKNTSEYLNDEQLVRTNRTLPSDKESDYYTLIITAEVKNNSIFSLMNFTGSINEQSSDSRILFSLGSVTTQYVKSLHTEDNLEIIWLEMYVGDMDQQELLEYIRQQEVTVYYSSKLFGVKNQTISLKNAVYRK